jgi:hypothetical protein
VVQRSGARWRMSELPPRSIARARAGTCWYVPVPSRAAPPAQLPPLAREQLQSGARAPADGPQEAAFRELLLPSFRGGRRLVEGLKDAVLAQHKVEGEAELWVGVEGLQVCQVAPVQRMELTDDLGRAAGACGRKEGGGRRSAAAHAAPRSPGGARRAGRRVAAVSARTAASPGARAPRTGNNPPPPPGKPRPPHLGRRVPAVAPLVPVQLRTPRVLPVRYDHAEAAAGLED